MFLSLFTFTPFLPLTPKAGCKKIIFHNYLNAHKIPVSFSVKWAHLTSDTYSLIYIIYIYIFSYINMGNMIRYIKTVARTYEHTRARTHTHFLLNSKTYVHFQPLSQIECRQGCLLSWSLINDDLWQRMMEAAWAHHLLAPIMALRVTDHVTLGDWRQRWH